MSLIEELKNINTERLTLDQLIALSSGSRTLAAEYSAQTLAEPEWLSDAKRTLATEIKRQVNDKLSMELREIEQAEAQLLTAAERRQNLAARKAEIQAKIAGQPVGV